MSRGAAVAGWARRRAGLAALGVLLFAVLGAVAVQLEAAQDERGRAAERRFEQRAQISAALTRSVFGALGNASATDLARRLEGPPSTLGRRLAALARRGRLQQAAVLDTNGRVLSSIGGLPHSRAGHRAPGVLSDVRRTTSGRVIEYGLPFRVRAGRRLLVQGVPLGVMRAFLQDYLRALPNPDRATLLVTDRAGTPLARVGPQGSPLPETDRLTTEVAVPGTTWRLRLQARRADVLAGSGRGAWIGWSLLGALALALMGGLWLAARVTAGARRTRVANRALRESEGKLRTLVGALEEAVFLTHPDGTVELLNDSARALADTDASVLPKPQRWAVSDDGLPLTEAETPAARTLADGVPRRQILGWEHPDRGLVWLDVRTRPLVRAGEHKPYLVVCTCSDVTERQNLEAHLVDLADRDPLTALWNRRRFEQDLAQQLDRCRRYDERAALVLMDVDGFKQVNDQLGHLAGDEVLCALGEALSARIRSTDRAARLGGDEFALLLLDVDEQEAARLAAELADELREAAALTHDRVSVQVSAGVAALTRHTGSLTAVIEMADRDMYAAKQRRSKADRPRGPRAVPIAPPAPEMASLRALLAAVNARDSYTAAHSREVVTLARSVARQLGLGEFEVVEIEHIALVHDLGKIAVPDAILRKSGRLLAHEQAVMRQHPVVGAEILASMPELAHLAPAVRAEHERWDGTGYPDGLAGEQIPLASRIALVCDAYHAMTSDRPYRRSMSPGAAREEIRREAGRQFCPRAAAALLAVLEAAPALTA